MDDRAALERAARIINWMAKALRHMAPPDGGYAELNEHWVYMESRNVQS